MISIICFLLTAAVLFGAVGERSPMDKAFNTFWKAGGPTSRGRAVKKILKINPSFEEVFKRLKAGRTYSAEVKRGLQTGRRAGIRGTRYPYAFYIPTTYDPARRNIVIFYLHGGVGSGLSRRIGWWNDSLEGMGKDKDKCISVFPVSWNESMWWEYGQVKNLGGILELLKQDYNIDENRVNMMGFSDGASAAFYYASKDTTPWAAFIPIIGSPNVLNSPGIRVDGEIFAANLSSKPFLVINGGRDPLYPAAEVKPFAELFRSAGCEIDFVPKPGYGHSMDWWSEEEQRVENFIGGHRRKPYPDALVWETEDTERFGRAHWLVVTRLGSVAGESELNPWNIIHPKGNEGSRRTAFVRKNPSGRVILQKKGNRVDAYTQGVKEFKLLISPEVFNFERPIRVFTNGAEVFSGQVSEDTSVLLKWAALDNDRTMLFGAELTIIVQSSRVNE